MVLAPTSPAHTIESLTEEIVRLLGDLLHEEPDDLRTRLLKDGSQMPVDSLDMFDILADFRAATALKLPVKKIKRDTLRSVQAFAHFAYAEGVTQ